MGLGKKGTGLIPGPWGHPSIVTCVLYCSIINGNALSLTKSPFLSTLNELTLFTERLQKRQITCKVRCSHARRLYRSQLWSVMPQDGANREGFVSRFGFRDNHTVSQRSWGPSALSKAIQQPTGGQGESNAMCSRDPVYLF